MNPIIFVLLAAVLIGAAFYLVALPLLQHARRSESKPVVTSEQERLDELLAQREAAFQALRELNFDHKVGKITDDDFRAFEANLKQNAAATLRVLDEWENEVDDELETVMEQAIRTRKALLVDPGSNGHDGHSCPKCGKLATARDRFCGACGEPLPQSPAPVEPAALELACSQCGTRYEIGDKFCAGCGQRLTVEVAESRAG